MKDILLTDKQIRLALLIHHPTPTAVLFHPSNPNQTICLKGEEATKIFLRYYSAEEYEDAIIQECNLKEDGPSPLVS
jgi:hypothetical protein